MNWNRRHILNAVWLMFVLLLMLNVSLAQETGILFSDNFEDGGRSEWSYWHTTHEIIEIDGNHVLHLQSGDGDDWGNIEILMRNEGNWKWTDYFVEARVKILSVDRNSSTPQFFVNLRNSPDGRNNYAGWLRFQPNSSGGGLGGSLNGRFRGIVGIDQYLANPQINTWHTIRLQANANEIAWSLDNELIIRAIDDEVTAGGVSFGLSPNVEIYLDDVRVVGLETQEKLIDPTYLNVDCTIPEPGKPSAFTINLSAGVNVRSLASDDFGLVTNLPQSANVGVIGWFDANGTPFGNIAGGTWLVLHDGNYAVKASLVSVVDAALTDVPVYRYTDNAFVAPEKDESEMDTSNRFDVTYKDYCTGDLVQTTQAVQINTDTMMPMPFGLVEPSEYPVVDETLDAFPDTGAVSGILIRVYEEPRNQDAWYLLVAFPLEDGSWETINVHALGNFTLRPVDSGLQSTDPSGEIFTFQPRTRINTNAVIAERTLHPGDHVVLFFRESDRNGGKLGCNNLPTTSEAIAHLIDGGTCKMVYYPDENGSVNSDLVGLMYLND